MINLTHDSDGTTFEVWKQDQMNSCGVASTWMARGLVRQMSYAEDEWGLAQRIYRNAIQNTLAALGPPPSGPMTFNPASFPRDQSSLGSTLANFGIYAGQLATAIRAEGMGCQHISFSRGVVRQIDPNKLGERKAAIALVYWNPRGGHFIVAARRASNGDIVFLDPWSGEVNEQPNDGAYFSTYGSRGAIGEVLYLN